MVALSRKVAFGDPLDEATKVGAIVSPEHQAKIDGYVEAAPSRRAPTVRLGGAPLEIPGLGGQFYAADRGRRRHARHGDRARGGVRPGAVGADLRDARRGGRASPTRAAYGLSAGVWSENVDTCLDVRAPACRPGTVWINTCMDGFAELPFGGVKESGQGRELGRYGLEEFLEVKTVQMRIGRTRAPWVMTT